MAAPRGAIPAQASVWDARRNTSQVFGVPPGALPAALAALAALRRNDPALVQWLEDGHPTLTEAEHLGRFGEPYRSTRTQRDPGPPPVPAGVPA